MIMKPNSIIQLDTNIINQLVIMNIPNTEDAVSDPGIDNLKTILEFGVEAYLDLLNNSGHLQNSSSKVMSNIKSKIKKLTLDLQNLHQTIQVPILMANIPPVLQVWLDDNHAKSQEDMIIAGEGLLSNPDFSSSLQSLIYRWAKNIQEVIHLDHDPSTGTINDEISFWMAKQSSLSAIKVQLEESPVLAMIQILQNSKKSHAAVALLSITEVTEALKAAAGHCEFFRNLNVDAIQSADTFDVLKASSGDTFSVFKKIRQMRYPLSRSIEILKLLASEYEGKLKMIIAKYNLFSLAEQEFTEALHNVQSCIDSFDTEVRICTNLIREQLRKNNNVFVALKVDIPRYLVDILNEIQKIRTYHLGFNANLIALVEKTDTSYHQHLNVCNELIVEGQRSYEKLYSIPPRDLLDSSMTILKENKRIYLQQVSLLEKRVVGLIRTILSDASDDSDTLFDIFEGLQFLLGQPQIKLLTNEFNSILLRTMELELDSLENQFQSRADLSSLISNMYVPNFTSNIIWSKQILHTVSRLFKRLEIVLTKDWAKYPQGKRLASRISVLISEIDVDVTFKAWIKEILERCEAETFTLSIVKTALKSDLKKQPRYVLTIQNSELDICDEIELLQIFKLNVPKEITDYSHKMKLIRNYALHAADALAATFECQSILEFNEGTKALTSKFSESVKSTMRHLAKGAWSRIIDLQEHNIKRASTVSQDIHDITFVLQYRDYVYDWFSKIMHLQSLMKRLLSNYHDLEVCEYDELCLSKIIEGIQSTLLDVNSLGVASIGLFVSSVNEQIGKILIRRYTAEMNTFQRVWRDGEFSLNNRIHYLSLNEASISLDIPIEESKQFFLDQLKRTTTIVCGQKCVSVPSVSSETQVSYFNIKRNNGISVYQNTLAMIMDSFHEMNDFLDKWRSVQCFWDFDYSSFTSSENSNLNDWLLLLVRVKELRATFDTTELYKAFGQVIINYEQGQRRVYNQFNQFQKTILESFGIILQGYISSIDERIQELEKSLTSAQCATDDSCSLVLLLSTLEKSREYLLSNENTIKAIHSGVIALMKGRGDLLPEWHEYKSFADNITHLKRSITHTTAYVESNRGAITLAISKETQIVYEGTKVLKSRWQAQKPDNETPLSQVPALLKNFEMALNKLDHDIQNIKLASKILGSECNFSVDPELKEISRSKDLWNVIVKFSSQLEHLESREWNLVSAELIKGELEGLLISSRDFPLEYQTFPAFKSVQLRMRNFIKCLPIISLVKNGSLDQTHWSELFLNLRGEDVPATLKLGDLLQLDLVANADYVKAVLVRAEAEIQVEKSIKEIENTWELEKFQVHVNDSAVPLLTGWSSLFSKNRDDAFTLESIRASAHSKRFASRVELIGNKIDTLFSIMELWCDIQKEWVYLNNILSSSADFERMMPIDVNRFKNATHEFKYFVGNALAGSIVMRVIEFPDVVITLKRIADTLLGIKRALYGYLEKQRELFPRFYFLGNDDLLELIGNSTNIFIIGKHIRKIFPSVSSLELDDNGISISAVISPENEKLVMSKPVSFLTQSSLVIMLKDLEEMIQRTLSHLIGKLVEMLYSEDSDVTLYEGVASLLMHYPNQIILLGFQIWATRLIETNAENGLLSQSGKQLRIACQSLTALVKAHDDLLLRVKAENLLIELIHKLSIIDKLSQLEHAPLSSFCWFEEPKVYLRDEDLIDTLSKVEVQIGNYCTLYGFEYLGAPQKLAYTPLLSSTYLLLGEALNQNLGGLLLGPAGTGKTESVKALGSNLGRLTFIFCCDEAFDVESVTRILKGISLIGAWGCFDEFNRLEENILSGISTQLEILQSELAQTSKVNPNTGIFITNNPTYDGRTTLPDNLKSKFLSYYLMRPDFAIIGQTLLTVQGFSQSAKLIDIVVCFFENLKKKCTQQVHYDFTLRTFKAVISYAGKLLRDTAFSASYGELDIILKSLSDVILPRLVRRDEKMFWQEVLKIEPSFIGPEKNMEVRASFDEAVLKRGLITSDNLGLKCQQLYEIQKMNSNIILLGPSGSGKTTTFNIVCDMMVSLKGVRNDIFRIDPKVLTKSSLFGSFDEATREWSDGVFTSIIRRISESFAEDAKRIFWIVFDGDIDPNWVENLNSVMDDNKTFTLPNGERLRLHANTRLIFETAELRFATPATISRCGVIIFDGSFCMHDMLKSELLENVSNLEGTGPSLFWRNNYINELKGTFISSVLNTLDQSTLDAIWDLCSNTPSVLSLTKERAVRNLSRFLVHAFQQIVEYCQNTSKFNDMDSILYFRKQCIFAIVWSYAGEFGQYQRISFLEALSHIGNLHKIFEGEDIDSIVYSRVQLPSCSFVKYYSAAQEIEMHSHMILGSGVVVPTKDTSVYQSLIHLLLRLHSPFILCGPPGSGKTMLLLSTIRQSADFQLISLNFSKETKVESLVKSMEQKCHYKSSGNELILLPKLSGTWIVLFCDEVNLPEVDRYETQVVIQFLRQMITQKGFWHPEKGVWVSLQNIQFVGACNPSDMAGRKTMTDRFLDYCTVIMVDYPSLDSLKQIYFTYTTALLRGIPDLRDFSGALSDAMVELYALYEQNYSCAKIAHYTSSPRELTRWTKGLYVALRHKVKLTLEELIRVWAHEGLRLFSDRLMSDHEKHFLLDCFKRVAKEAFPHRNVEQALKGPILFSDWINYEYQSVDGNELKSFVRSKFDVFNEEDSSVDIILHDDMLDNILRIDRVLKNDQGHMILVGPSGIGKTTLTKFVCWMNGIDFIQLSVNTGFTLSDFQNILRKLLVDAVIKDKKVCFLIDESTILDDAFLEIMNTLLANGEVPGLFEGHDYDQLIEMCLKASQAAGSILETEEELYSWFIGKTTNNFHVVFTMGNLYLDTSKSLITSPALFNRCVVNWMGSWKKESLRIVAAEYTKSIALDVPGSHNQQLNETLVGLHETVIDVIITFYHRIKQDLGFEMSVTHFLHFLRMFSSAFMNHQQVMQIAISHTNRGLDQLKETSLKMRQLGRVLETKEKLLQGEEVKARKLLDKMITDQNEAERKQDMSMKMQELFEQQERKISSRRELVLKELTDVEYLLEEAQQGVMNIKKPHLTEIRSMHNPPETIKLVLESICILLGYEVSSWRDVQQVIRKDDFISSIVGFDGKDKISPELIRYMESYYLNRDNFNYESADHASKACGPLFMWVKAQLRFSSIVVKVNPLKRELEMLENELQDTKAKVTAINGMIEDLQLEVEDYKLQYSETIKETEVLKMEMITVKGKLDRSVALLSSLSFERERWERNIKDYEVQGKTLVGDTLLQVAFLAFGGLLNPFARSCVLNIWKEELKKHGILYDPKIGPDHMPGLVSPAEIGTWFDLGIPNDEQFIGNTAILTSPLNVRPFFVIDPADLFLHFLTKLFPEKKLVISSFLEPDFAKILENCVKFGGTLLIRDGEYYDPIISCLLSGSVTLMGTKRKLVRLGEREVDLSPDFKLYIMTNDPTIKIPSFVLSRVCVLNYSFTLSTMKSEAINLALQLKEPEVQETRIRMLKTSSQCITRLSSLEQELLDTMTFSQDTICDNDELLTKLETIKTETISLNAKLKAMDEVGDRYIVLKSELEPLGEFYAKASAFIEALTSRDTTSRFPSNYMQSILKSVCEKYAMECSEVIISHLSLELYKNLAISLRRNDSEILQKFLLTTANLDKSKFESMDIKEVILASSVVLIRTDLGNDCSAMLSDISDSISVEILRYSMGSKDSNRIVKQLLWDNKDENKWIVIENIEMSNSFLKTITETINTLKSTTSMNNLKIIMTAKLESLLPSALLLSCTQVIMENDEGLKGYVSELLLSPSSSFFISDLCHLRSKELRCLDFMLVWLYSLTLARLRYAPSRGGFLRRYEINLNDLKNAKKFVDKFITNNSDKGEFTRASMEVLAKFVSGYIFGGKIDVDCDLSFMVNSSLKLLNLENLRGDRYNLLVFHGDNGNERFLSPKDEGERAYREWVDLIPTEEPMAWLGLEESVRFESTSAKELKTQAEMEAITKMIEDMK